MKKGKLKKVSMGRTKNLSGIILLVLFYAEKYYGFFPHCGHVVTLNGSEVVEGEKFKRVNAGNFPLILKRH